MKIQKKDVWLLLLQLSVAVFIIMTPAIVNYFSTNRVTSIPTTLHFSLAWMMPVVLIYFTNFYVLIPLLFFRHNKWGFILANILIITIFNIRWFRLDSTQLPDYGLAGYYSYFVAVLLLALLSICLAVSIRSAMRRNEQHQKNIEAELTWLRNQLSPHFLFNTLNNISSLTQIDADKAQDAVMQLSDLMRYALYEANKSLVPLSGEIEFMRNYIDLMKLRCNENTTVTFHSDCDESASEVAPLLFISMIENAFKHGVNSNLLAAIDIRITQDGNSLVFECDNTNNPMASDKRSGSGIGLDNTRRRLQLLYPNRHEWKQSITPENMYHIKIALQL